MAKPRKPRREPTQKQIDQVVGHRGLSRYAKDASYKERIHLALQMNDIFWQTYGEQQAAAVARQQAGHQN